MMIDLHDHQWDTVGAIIEHGGFMLCDAPGTGRSVAAAAAIEATVMFPALVVAPLSLLRSFGGDFGLVSSGRKTLVLKSKNDLEHLVSHDVVAVNFEKLNRPKSANSSEYIDSLSRVHFRSVLCYASSRLCGLQKPIFDWLVTKARQARFRIAIDDLFYDEKTLMALRYLMEFTGHLHLWSEILGQSAPPASHRLGFTANCTDNVIAARTLARSLKQRGVFSARTLSEIVEV